MNPGYLYSNWLFILSLLAGISTVPLSAHEIPCVEKNRQELLKKSQQYDQIISRVSRKYRVDAHLIRAVIAVESCYNPQAVSPAGARGLMQILPETAERFGVKNIDIPANNIEAGTRYLHFLQRLFHSQLDKVLAAYNAGEGKVQAYQAIPPYKETQHYVADVIRTYKKLSQQPGLVSEWGKPGRQGIAVLKRKAPHLFKSPKQQLTTTNR